MNGVPFSVPKGLSQQLTAPNKVDKDNRWQKLCNLKTQASVFAFVQSRKITDTAQLAGTIETTKAVIEYHAGGGTGYRIVTTKATG